jgi:hypothetical protein
VRLRLAELEPSDGRSPAADPAGWALECPAPAPQYRVFQTSSSRTAADNVAYALKVQGESPAPDPAQGA